MNQFLFGQVRVLRIVRLEDRISGNSSYHLDQLLQLVFLQNEQISHSSSMGLRVDVLRISKAAPASAARAETMMMMIDLAFRSQDEYDYGSGQSYGGTRASSINEQLYGRREHM
jgi:hypothetical protein